MSSNATNAKTLADAQKEINNKDSSNEKFSPINIGNKRPTLYKLLQDKDKDEKWKITYPQKGRFYLGSELKDAYEVVIPKLVLGTKIIINLLSAGGNKSATYYLGPRSLFETGSKPKASSNTRKNKSVSNANRSNSSSSSPSLAQQRAVEIARNMDAQTKPFVSQKNRNIAKARLNAKKAEWNSQRGKRKANREAAAEALAQTRRNAASKARAANAEAKEEKAKQDVRQIAIDFFEKKMKTDKRITLELPEVKAAIARAYKFKSFVEPNNDELEEMILSNSNLTNSERRALRNQRAANSLDNEIFNNIAKSRNGYIEIPNGALKEALIRNATNQTSNIDVPVGNGKGRKFTLQRYSEKLKNRNIISIIDPKDDKPKMFIGPKVVASNPVPSLRSKAARLENTNLGPSVSATSSQQTAANNGLNLGSENKASASELSSKPTRIQVANETRPLKNILSKANNQRFLDQKNNKPIINDLNLGSESVNLLSPKNEEAGFNLGSEKSLISDLNLGSESAKLPFTNQKTLRNPRVKVISGISGITSKLAPPISSLKKASTTLLKPKARSVTFKNQFKNNANALVPTNASVTKRIFNRSRPSRFAKTPTPIPVQNETLPIPGPLKGFARADSYLVSYGILLAYQSSDRFIRIDNPSFVKLILIGLQNSNTKIQSGFILQGGKPQNYTVDQLIFTNSSKNAKNSKAIIKASAILVNILEKINRIIVKDQMNNFFMGPNDYFQTEGESKKNKVLSQNNADNIILSLPSDKKRLVNSNNKLIGDLKSATEPTIRVVYNLDGSIESITPISGPFDYSGMDKITNSTDPNITVMYRDSVGKIYTEFALPELYIARKPGESIPVAIGGTRKRKSFPPVKTRRRR